MSLFTSQQKILFCLCSPHRVLVKGGRHVLDVVTVDWHRARQAMSMPANCNYFELHCDGMEVGEARAQVARRCLDHDPRPEFIFFLDDDVIVPQDALVKLFFRARTHPQYDVYAGVYCLKRPGLPEPLIYGEHGQGPLWDWTVGDILTTEGQGVRSVHMGLSLVRVSAFQKLIDAGLVNGDGTDPNDEPFFKTISETRRNEDGTCWRHEGTEDIYFCDKLIKAGGRILVDTSVLGAHQDKASGIKYGLPLDKGPAAKAKWLPNADKSSADRDEANGLKLALDLGAGNIRREWPGHKTYTLDADPTSGADYIQDLRLLNLPSDHYDLVASSHSFEHIPRWEQEDVWRETFRVCRPGGKLEITVPNVEWAAWKITEGDMDEHAMNVLYGSQEAAGIDRLWNLHYFGYTPAVGKALAEAVGFVNVTTESYRQDADLGYHLIIKGEKPNRSRASDMPVNGEAKHETNGHAEISCDEHDDCAIADL